MLPYKVLKFFDDVTSALVAVLLALLAVYAGYALWDNQQVYAAAEEVQASLLTLKPQEGGVPFAELRAVNADVCAWVTLDGTGVDYPVVQGKDNLTYVNTDVYGNFSLAGTIFLDTRCAPDFAGGYSLLYGHHMVSGQMFGDLEKYQDAAFLREHRTGTLLLPDGACTLEVFACLLVPASEEHIFRPEHWQEDVSPLLDWAEGEALCWETTDRPQRVLAMSTCSSAFTDARTVVLAAIQEGWGAPRPSCHLREGVVR